MRYRLPLLLLLAGTVVWWGCEEQMAPQTAEPDSPVFAKGGPACDTKGAPVRDYFKLKTTQQTVNALLHDLGTACADGDTELALSSGFSILEWVETTRESPADVGSPSDGAVVVAVVWNMMQPFVCVSGSNCFAPVIDGNQEGDVPLSSVVSALSLQGAFGVRARPAGIPDASAISDPDEPVISYGNSNSAVLMPVPYWGIEPFMSTWADVLPTSRALVLGYPDYDSSSGLGELPLGTPVAYDWSVLPWYSDPTGVDPLSVTVCASAEAGYKEKVAHGGSILADGQDTWCEGFLPEEDDPLFASSGLGAGLTRLARSLIPFWPHDLNATVMGVSGSGKAREFSPYFGHQVDPEGLVTFITDPGDATAYDPGTGIPAGSNLICDMDSGEIPVDATECPEGHGIRVHLTTSASPPSPLSGDDHVLLVVTAEDNNGSWSLYGTLKGEKVDVPGYGLVYEWNNLALDKPGAYKLHTYRTDAEGCVFDDDGNKIEDWGPCENSVGLAFPAASSERFNVNP